MTYRVYVTECQPQNADDHFDVFIWASHETIHLHRCENREEAFDFCTKVSRFLDSLVGDVVAKRTQHLDGVIRHAAQCLRGEVDLPTIAELRKARGLEPL